MQSLPLIDPKTGTVIDLSSETKFAANGIVSRTLLTTPNGKVILFGFAQGQELTEHTSTQHALVQILSGECEFQLGSEIRHVKAGDIVYMPPRMPHALKAITDFSMLLTMIKPGATLPTGWDSARSNAKTAVLDSTQSPLAPLAV